jgi:uncharacterized membrane protein
MLYPRRGNIYVLLPIIGLFVPAKFKMERNLPLRNTFIFILSGGSKYADIGHVIHIIIEIH